MTGALLYNTNSLQTFNPTTKVGIITNQIKHTNIADKDLSLYGLAKRYQSVLTYVGYPAKKISIAGAIVGSSQTDLDNRIDAFKAFFNGKDKNLDIDYAGSTRRYIATANSVAVEREDHALFAKFSIEFVCTQPFGRNTTLTAALNATGRTLSGYTDNHTFLGSAPLQLPIITLTYTAVSGGAGYVSWGNSANGQGILITDQTFVAADVLEINTMLQTVKKNNVEIDFIGAFPEFEPGNQSFAYSDGFATRTFNELVNYYPMWQ